MRLLQAKSGLVEWVNVLRRQWRCANVPFKEAVMMLDSSVVVNVVGSGRDSCGCGSWIDHWKRTHRKTVAICSIQQCIVIDVEGAHVRRPHLSKTRIEIIPMCHEHNMASGPMRVKHNTEFADAAVCP